MRIPAFWPAFWRSALLVLGIGLAAVSVADAVRAPSAAAGEEGPTYLVNRELLHLSSPGLDLSPSTLAVMGDIAEEVSASEAGHAR